jgi:hypothetical protein
MDDDMILAKLALDELQELGYTEVWIGPVDNPHWPDHFNGQFVIAAPRRRRDGWPALWSASEEVFGKMACGNGLKNADHCQRANVRRMKPGHYRLAQGTWTIVQGQK